jgi:hypothetical protein
MKSRFPLRAFLVLELMALMPAAYPCTWAVGYFHQVTRLRGTVVGVNNGDLRHPFRWMRQRVVRSDVRLTLYEYRWPVKGLGDLPVVKVIRTDSHGAFDFGTLPKGHYSLGLEDPWIGTDWFDVEIASLPKRIDLVRIDISPVWPDCTGGHEFLSVAE